MSEFTNSDDQFQEPATNSVNDASEILYEHGISEKLDSSCFVLQQESIPKRTSQRTERSPKTSKGRDPLLTEPLSTPFSKFSFGDPDKHNEQTSSKASKANLPRVKTKTRGTPGVEVARAPSLGTPSDTGKNEQPKIAVDAKSKKVFSMLFHDPGAPRARGQLRWEDFLHAMAQAGFAGDPLGGSVRRFTPMKLDVSRAINFHEPHPTSKLNHRLAQKFGRRLNLVYGWDAATFVLAGKDTN